MVLEVRVFFSVGIYVVLAIRILLKYSSLGEGAMFWGHVFFSGACGLGACTMFCQHVWCSGDMYGVVGHVFSSWGIACSGNMYGALGTWLVPSETMI